MTLTQKIIARHSGLDRVTPGQLVEASADLVLGNDITTPVAIREMAAHGLESVFDRGKIALVLDHFTPNKDIDSAAQCAVVREFAQRHGITHFYEGGEAGIEHVLIPEKGLAAPGELIVGADSHTCTYGALGAFATGVGSTDMAAGMYSGKCWLRVPEAVKVTLTGTPARHVSGKDIALSLIGELGVDGARYMSLEFFGGGALGIDDRLTVANMAVECGAKNGIFPSDERTREYLAGRLSRPYLEEYPDRDAEYARELTIALGALEPLVAAPDLPSNVFPARELGHVALDQVVVGSCTNGRLTDLRAAAAILRGKRVARGLRCVVIPGSPEVYLAALREGLIGEFIEAGCVVSPPTCGPCLGGHMGVLAAGERCLSTTNRNFTGRMGHPSSEVYLASPAVAAASALAGHIAAPE